MTGKKRKSLIALTFLFDSLVLLSGIILALYRSKIFNLGAVGNIMDTINIDYVFICLSAIGLVILKFILCALYHIIGKIRTELALYYACLAVLFILILLVLGISLKFLAIQIIVILAVIIIPYISYEMAKEDERKIRKRSIQKEKK